MSGQEMRDECRAVEGRRVIAQCDDSQRKADMTQQDQSGTNELHLIT